MNITGLLKYVSLEQPPEYWANEIEKMPNIDREMASIKACEALRNAGYDIKVEAKTRKSILVNARGIEMKHLAIVTRNMKAGGAERVIAQLVKCFSKDGINCTIITLDDEEIFYDLLQKLVYTQLVRNHQRAILISC